VAPPHKFVNETRRGRRTHLRGYQPFFQFYTGDFLAHASSLIEYVNRDRTEPISQDLKVRFLDYAWTVNQRLVPGLWFCRPGFAAAPKSTPGRNL
jgi:hypothetical protein